MTIRQPQKFLLYTGMACVIAVTLLAATGWLHVIGKGTVYEQFVEIKGGHIYTMRTVDYNNGDSVIYMLEDGAITDEYRIDRAQSTVTGIDHRTHEVTVRDYSDETDIRDRYQAE